MPWNESQKSCTRQHILESAALLFSQKGFDGTSIDTVMEHAGLTRGAFYAHFTSKSDLYAEALHCAGLEHYALLKDACPRDRVFAYLSEAHRKTEAFNCPLACLISDVAQQDERVRDTYTRLFDGFVSHCHGNDSDPDKRKLAMQQAVALIGGIAISRNLTDESLAQELLDACRSLALDLMPAES